MDFNPYNLHLHFPLLTLLNLPQKHPKHIRIFKSLLLKSPSFKLEQSIFHMYIYLVGGLIHLRPSVTPSIGHSVHRSSRKSTHVISVHRSLHAIQLHALNCLSRFLSLVGYIWPQRPQGPRGWIRTNDPMDQP